MESRRPCDNIDPEIVPTFFFSFFWFFCCKKRKKYSRDNFLDTPNIFIRGRFVDEVKGTSANKINVISSLAGQFFSKILLRSNVYYAGSAYPHLFFFFFSFIVYSSFNIYNNGRKCTLFEKDHY